MEATEARLAVYREAAVARWQARQQLERALRVFRRLRTEQARESHELEYLDYYRDEDGCLVLRARLAAEDGALLVRALDAARERVRARRPAERRAGPVEQAAANAAAFEPPRAANVEALIELSEQALTQPENTGEPEPARACAFFCVSVGG